MSHDTVKHQLQVMDRSRRRAPRLTPWDRLVFELCACCIPIKRLAKCAVILKPSIMRFHRALVRCKYRWLYASGKRYAAAQVSRSAVLREWDRS
jgi:putative transposase